MSLEALSEMRKDRKGNSRMGKNEGNVSAEVDDDSDGGDEMEPSVL